MHHGHQPGRFQLEAFGGIDPRLCPRSLFLFQWNQRRGLAGGRRAIRGKLRNNGLHDAGALANVHVAFAGHYGGFCAAGTCTYDGVSYGGPMTIVGADMGSGGTAAISIP